MSVLPKRVHLMEVGPRDGLQIEPKILSTAEKLELIGMIEDAGVKEIEVGSFVNPKAVPTMADTAEVFAGIVRKPGVIYRGLSLNTRGVERAMATPNVDLDGRLHVTCSEVFVKRNTNRSIDDTFRQLPEWITLYKKAGVPTDGVTMMAVFGCNFEGDIPLQRVVDILARTEDILAAHGETLKFANLCDTMGWAQPEQIKHVVGSVRNRWPKLQIKLHLHDTRGLAMANAYAALEMGIDEFDASIGALGGCPFAGHKGAAGNICTEDLAFMCEEMGIATGIDVDKLAAAARRAEQMVGHPVPGKVMKGGTLKEKRSSVG
jgi:hydroxymethylglutaryl-CoA lyase